MRRLFNHNATIPALLGLAAAFFLMPHIAHAGFLEAISTPVLFVTKIYSALVEVVVLPLAAGVLYLAGMMLDSALYFSLHTAYIFSLSPAINLGWVIVRDIINIFFIFILIRISLGTIVNGLRFGTMTMLKNVIIAALLINFSLFITKAAVDVSNIFGNWLYGGIQKTLVANSSNQNDPVTLSGLIISRLHIVQYWSSGAAQSNNGTDLTDMSKGIINSFIRLTVISITTYVFLYATVLFLTRAITLLFLLVFSPVGFIGKVLPQVEEYSSEWRKELTSAAIFPIAFLLMLYISLQFINSLDVITNSSNLFWAAKEVNTTNNVSVFGASFNVFDIFKYVLVMFLLQGTLKVAKQYSGQLGKQAGDVLAGVGKMAITASAGLGVGIAGFAGRRVLGAAASSLAGNATINDMAAGKVGGSALGRWGNQVVGKGMLSGLQATSKASFDVRNVGAVNNLAKAAGLDLGKAGGKDGFKGMVKEREEAEKKFAEGFGDTPEGIERRMAYAEDRRNSIFTRLAVGDKAAGKLADKVRGEAGTAFTKAQTEKAKNEAQAIKNEIIAETMAQETLSRATKLKDGGPDKVAANMDEIIKQEQLRADRMLENSRKNPKNELVYNRYRHAEAVKNNNVEEQKKLQAEFNIKTANMNKKDKDDLLKPDNKKVAEIAELESYYDNYKRGLETARLYKDLEEKRKQLTKIKDETIKSRIGTPPTGWVKPTETKPGYYTDEGEGLAKQLKAKKVELEKARREQAIMEGKEPPQKPIAGDTEARAEDKKDEE